MGSFLCGFVLTIVCMPFFIQWMKRKQIQQPVSVYLQHDSKKQTPTMAGVVMVFCLLLAVYIANVWISQDLYVVHCMSSLVCACMVIGIIDDVSNIRAGRNYHAFSIKKRMILELCASLIFSVAILSHLDDLSIWNLLLATITIAAYMNAYNITDGLDGLSSTQGVIVLCFLAIYAKTNVTSMLNVTCLNILYVAIGILVAFLWFNAPKAAIFMGDTGSLAIGALIGGIVVLLRCEFLSIGFAIILVCNALSSFLQIMYFKITGGSRLFRIAPLHHLCESYSWNESKIVFRFAIIAIVVGLVTLWIKSFF